MRTSTPRILQSFAHSYRAQLQGGINIDIALQKFSGKHGGLYLYVGRIMRPIWSLRCIKQEIMNGKTQILTTVSCNQVGWILSHLQALSSFLNKNTQISRT